jgi:hypothetical protein
VVQRWEICSVKNISCKIWFFSIYAPKCGNIYLCLVCHNLFMWIPSTYLFFFAKLVTSFNKTSINYDINNSTAVQIVQNIGIKETNRLKIRERIEVGVAATATAVTFFIACFWKKDVMSPLLFITVQILKDTMPNK